MLVGVVFDENGSLSFDIVNGPLDPGQQTKAVMTFKHMLFQLSRSGESIASLVFLLAIVQHPPSDHQMLAVVVFDENVRLSFDIVNGPLDPGRQTNAVMTFKHMLFQLS